MSGRCSAWTVVAALPCRCRHAACRLTWVHVSSADSLAPQLLGDNLLQLRVARRLRAGRQQGRQAGVGGGSTLQGRQRRMCLIRSLPCPSHIVMELALREAFTPLLYLRVSALGPLPHGLDQVRRRARAVVTRPPRAAAHPPHGGRCQPTQRHGRCCCCCGAAQLRRRSCLGAARQTETSEGHSAPRHTQQQTHTCD